MLLKRPSRWKRITRHRTVRLLADMAAGVHVANGLAHGVPPSRRSRARSGYAE